MSGAGQQDTSQPLPESFDRRHVSHARPYTIWDAPRAVKQIFAKFPLHTAASEPRPAYLKRLDRLQAGPAIQLWSNTLSDDARVPSYNVNCLKYQTLLLARGIRFDIVRTVSDGSPDGQLPFLITTNASKQASIVRSSGIEAFVRRRTGHEERDTHTAGEAEGLGILEKDIRAAWLYSCYLTPENFRNVVFKLYVASVTHARLSHYAMLDRIYDQARDEFSKLEYTLELGRSSWRDQRPPSNLDLAVSLNKRAGAALDHLVQLLDGQTFFSGTDEPGLLDAAVFSYTHLLTRSGFADGISWVDTRLGKEFVTREALMRHEEAVRDFCFDSRGQPSPSETKPQSESFADVHADSTYPRSQTSFSELNESAYQESQLSYEEIGESSYQPESQDSYAHIETEAPPHSQPTSVSMGDMHDEQDESRIGTEIGPAPTGESSRADDDGAAMSSSHLFA